MNSMTKLAGSTNVDKTVLRRMTQADLPFVVDTLARILPTLPNYVGVKVNKLHLKYMLESNMNNDAHLAAWVLVNQEGIIKGGSAGYCVKLLFADDYLTGDVFLYVDEEYRTLSNAIRLIGAYKQWAISRDAKLITVSHTGGYRTELMDKLLQRLDFKPVGALYHLRRD